MNFNPNMAEIKAKLQALMHKAPGSGNVGTQTSKAGSLALAALKPILHLVGKYSFDNEKILGVEISPHYIRICQMKSSYGRWSLNQLASTCMETQFTNLDIQMNMDLYVDNLKALLEKHHIKTKDTALSIPTSVSIIKIINMPDMEEEDLAGAAAMGGIWESMVQLSGGIYEYSVYYKLLRRKIKPSESLALKDLQAAAAEVGLDNLLSAEPVTAPAAPAIPEPQVVIKDFSNILQEVGALNTQPAEASLDNILGSSSEIPQPEIKTESLDNILSETTDVSNILGDSTEISSSNEDGQILAQEVASEPVAEQPAAIPEEEATTMDVLFVAAKKSDIALYTTIAQRAGLNPIIVDIKADALKHAFDTNPDKRKIPEPYALLEFGADENYIYIVEGEGVSTYSIPLAEEDKQLMARHEENLEAFKGFTERFAGKLQEILTNYTKQKKSKVYNIFVSSCTPLHVQDASAEPLIHSFIEYLSEIMSSAKILSCNFCNHIEVPAEFAKKVNAEGNLSSWATVLGLATYKLDIFDYHDEGTAIDHVNLLPEAQSIRKTRSTKILSTLAMAALLAMVVFVSGVSYSMLLSKSSTLSAEIQKLDKVKDEYDDKNKEMQKLSIVMDKVKSLDGVRNKLPSNQLQILNTYKNITKSIPEGVWLSDMKYTAPKDVEINGNSINDQNILEFVDQLNQSGGFKKVALKTMAVQENKANEKGGTNATGASAGVKKFTLVGELPIDEKTQKLEILSGGVK